MLLLLCSLLLVLSLSVVYFFGQCDGDYLVAVQSDDSFFLLTRKIEIFSACFHEIEKKSKQNEKYRENLIYI